MARLFVVNQQAHIPSLSLNTTLPLPLPLRVTYPMPATVATTASMPCMQTEHEMSLVQDPLLQENKVR